MQDEQGKSGTNRGMPSNQPIKCKRKQLIKHKFYHTQINSSCLIFCIHLLNKPDVARKGFLSKLSVTYQKTLVNSSHSSNTWNKMQPFDSQTMSVWYKTVVCWQVTAMQTLENSFVFNTLFFAKFTILSHYLMLFANLKWASDLVRAWQCIIQWIEVASGAKSFTLFANPDHALIVAGALSVHTEHTLSNFKSHFWNHLLFLIYQLIML